MKGKQLGYLFLLFWLVDINLLLVFPSIAQQEPEYQLRLSISIRPYMYVLPIQTLPITVSFNIENMGTKTFNGKVTLNLNTEKHNYLTKTFIINNLTNGQKYENSTSYATDDEGRYWARVYVDANDSSRISLYVGSILKDSGIIVQYEDSIFLYSLNISITILGVIITIVSLIAYILKHNNE